MFSGDVAINRGDLKGWNFPTSMYVYGEKSRLDPIGFGATV